MHRPRRRGRRISPGRGGRRSPRRLFLLTKRPIALFIRHSRLPDSPETAIKKRSGGGGDGRFARSIGSDLADDLDREVCVFACLGPNFDGEALYRRSRRHHERQHRRIAADLDRRLPIAAIEDLFGGGDLRRLARPVDRSFTSASIAVLAWRCAIPSISSGGGVASALTLFSSLMAEGLL